MSKLTAEMSTGQHMRKVREYSFHGSVQFCPLSPIVQFHHFQISMGHVASEILALPPFRQSVTRIWRQTPPEGFCHMSSFQILHYKSYPEKDFVEERFFSSLMGPSLTTQGMVAQKVVCSKQDDFLICRTCGGPGLSSPKLKLVAKNPNGKAPGGDFRKQALIITIKDPEICLKSIHSHAHHSSHRYRRTCESPQAGLPQSRILKKHNLLKALKESTMLVKWFGGPENGLLVVGSALWPWGLGGTFSLCLQVVSSRNMVTIDNEHTQCSPGIFAIRITTAIQRNNFIFTNASLKQCDRIRNSGTKTFQEVHLAHRAYLSVRSGLQPLSWMFYTMWI